MNRIAFIVVQLLTLTFGAANAGAQTKCGSVAECADKMVGIAVALSRQNAKLREDVIRLENTLTKDLDDTAKKLTDERSAANSAVEARIVRLKNGGLETDMSPSSGNTRSATCPAGSYMISQRFKRSSGGCCGIVSNVQPFCKAMN